MGTVAPSARATSDEGRFIDPFAPEALSLGALPSIDYKRYEIRGMAVYIDAPSEDAAKLILHVFKVFPDPLLREYLAGMTVKVVPREEYDAIQSLGQKSFSPSMGVKIRGRDWYLRDDILSPQELHLFSRRVWYAVSAMLAKAMDDADGFDAFRFQAAFTRYLYKRLGSRLALPWLSLDFFLPDVDTLYQIFLNLLAESPDLSPRALRETFAEARRRFDNVRGRTGSQRARAMRDFSPWDFSDAYSMLASRGYDFRLTQGNALRLSLQSSEQRERPESSHRLSFSYAYSPLGRIAGHLIESIFPDSEASFELWPGLVASYETRTPDGNKRAALLVGTLMDAGFMLPCGRLTFHSYLGIPVTVYETGDDDTRHLRDVMGMDPEWELGINFRSADDTLFAGAVISFSFLNESQRYIGFMLRYDGSL